MIKIEYGIDPPTLPYLPLGRIQEHNDNEKAEKNNSKRSFQSNSIIIKSKSLVY